MSSSPQSIKITMFYAVLDYYYTSTSRCVNVSKPVSKLFVTHPPREFAANVSTTISQKIDNVEASKCAKKLKWVHIYLVWILFWIQTVYICPQMAKKRNRRGWVTNT